VRRFLDHRWSTLGKFAMTFLLDGPLTATHTILLAHGAGGAMDAPAMIAIASNLADAGFRVARFEFDYMAGRRNSTGRRPPPRAEALKAEYLAAIEALGARGPVIIGGKSMGGRVASMVADETYDKREIVGLLCVGYPFHPIGKPQQLRTAHLADMRTPTLIVQGARDPFGNRAEVSTYRLSKRIETVWLEDGDHDLKPRKRLSGYSAADHLQHFAQAAAEWAKRIAP
jgi:predicted alpha/beta-hydrolase family hydrolase